MSRRRNRSITGIDFQPTDPDPNEAVVEWHRDDGSVNRAVIRWATLFTLGDEETDEPGRGEIVITSLMLIDPTLELLRDVPLDRIRRALTARVCGTQAFFDGRL